MGKPKWEFNKDKYPDQRANWAGMKRSQKAYTIDQYNKARATRKLPPIPNPFREGGYPPVLAAGTALAKKFPTFVGVETVTPVSTNTKTIYPKGEKAPNPILEFSDDELTGLFETPSFQRMLDKVNEQNKTSTTTTVSSISDSVNTPGTSGVTHTKNTTPRGEIDPEEPPSKKPHIETTTDMARATYTGAGRESDMEVDNVLNVNSTHNFSSPMGTAGAAAGLAIEKGDIIPDVPRPYNFRMHNGYGHITNAFSMVSYGFASRILNHPGNPIDPGIGNAKIVVGTTPLLEIPWDRVHMYMNPGVYDSLPLGTYIKSVHCKVIQRNIRVAFETATSDTTLATLNQNKFTLIAIGLNNKNDIRVSNMRYGVDPTKSMIPTQVSDPVYDDIDECLYAYPQSNAKFNAVIGASNEYAIPCVNFSFNTILHPRNYLVAWNTGYKAPSDTENVKDRGWYNLSSHIRKCPTGKVIDQVIVNESYYPTYAPLKGQLEFAEYLRDNLNITTPVGTEIVNLNKIRFADHDIGKQFDLSEINVDASSNNNPTETQTTLATDRNSYTLQVKRMAMIEKGQYYKQIDSNPNGKYIQPSIHVGVAAVPKLTTTTDLLLPDDFSDVQAYYDVELSMVVGFNYAHQNTYQNVFNVNANEIRMGYNTSEVGNRPTHLLPNRFGHQATM